MSESLLLVIGGPTASGKTGLSIAIAKEFGCPILSSDSRQFYREMNIGTAKPTKAELQQAQHHFIDHLSIHDNYSVGQYERDALRILEDCFAIHPFAIMVGGTGLYAKAVMNGLDHFPKVPDDIKSKWRSLSENNGIQFLQDALAKVDPDYHKIVDLNNPHRLIRALSVTESSGLPFSSFLRQQEHPRPFQTLRIAIIPERESLYGRINNRVDRMILDGLIDEAKALYPHRHLQSLNTVGYKELFKCFDGEWSESHAIDKIKQHTRNYAKRQYTWFKNQGDWHEQSNWEVDEILSLVSAKNFS
ncbi:MAG: tRNA (adenosine(37)-N6)-dimethylallyltransferase MiaA [Bacteroidota bacterium]